MYHRGNFSQLSGSVPLSERVRRRRLAYGNRVEIAEYRDTPEETFQKIINLVRDSQDNKQYTWELRDWALMIARQANAETHDDMIVAVFEWIRDNMVYTKDPAYNELIHSAEVLMHRYFSGQGLHGDCDDFTILICSLLLALGISCKARMIKLPAPDGSVHFMHIYPLALTESGQWIALDATEHEPIGWEPPNWGVKDFRF